MQALVRNRFVGPDTTGTAEGAALGLLLVFLTYPLGLGIWLAFTDTTIGRYSFNAVCRSRFSAGAPPTIAPSGSSARKASSRTARNASARRARTTWR